LAGARARLLVHGFEVDNFLAVRLTGNSLDGLFTVWLRDDLYRSLNNALRRTPDRQDLIARSQLFNDVSDRDNVRFIKKIGGSALSMQQMVISANWPSTYRASPMTQRAI
jgi:hypothetical protein